ncbi:hypothetical protein P886_2466 [Alteromonadaceae bacterium 2753L.S.0a.02]|nr:hypothetical protein P886_2466 [Alteromonadaceae bacterium 2753L.S.0a.02]
MIAAQIVQGIYSSYKTRIFVSLVLIFGAAVLVYLDLIPIINGLLLLALCGLLICLCNARSGIWKSALFLATVFLGFFVAIYKPENFQYVLVWHSDSLYDNGKPFSLFLNASKALGGYLVLVWLFDKTLLWGNCAASTARWRLIVIPALGVITLVIVAHFGFAIGWQPKLPEGSGLFILINLIVTVFSEEAFFRLLLQRQIQKSIARGALGVSVAVLVSAVLFTVSHVGATGPLFLLFLLAGVIYAGVFAYTNSFVAAVLVHFGVNLCHFTLLEYPL